MRELIYIVVESFYKKALTDILIGYHFAHFQDSLALKHHLARITTFWELQLTQKISIPMEGKPFSLLFTHMQLGIKRGELGRWVLLFLKTLDELENEMPELREISTQWKKRIQFFNEHFQKRLFDGP